MLTQTYGGRGDDSDETGLFPGTCPLLHAAIRGREATFSVVINALLKVRQPRRNGSRFPRESGDVDAVKGMHATSLGIDKFENRDATCGFARSDLLVGADLLSKSKTPRILTDTEHLNCFARCRRLHPPEWRVYRSRTYHYLAAPGDPESEDWCPCKRAQQWNMLDGGPHLRYSTNCDALLVLFGPIVKNETRTCTTCENASTEINGAVENSSCLTSASMSNIHIKWQ